MQTLLQTLLCFVFVAQSVSQPGTYSGRRRTVVKQPVLVEQKPIFNPKPMNPKPIHPKPINQVVFGGQNSAFGQGSFMGGSSELEFIRELQGSTKFGRILKPGEVIDGITLPEHGGTLEASGITADGRGAVAPGGLPKNAFNDGWQHPWGGNPIPSDYAGQELIFDQALGHYVYVKSANAGHQINKETHTIQKAIGVGQSVVPASHNIAKSNMAVEHSIVKEADHIARKTVGGVQVVGGGMGFDPVSHNTIKTSGSGIIIAGKPTYQGGVIKSGGADPVSHNMIKASAGAGFGVNPMSHNMVKASVAAQSGMSGGHIGGFGVDPTTHNIAKSASVGIGGIGVDPFNHNIAKDSQFQHNVVKSSGVGGHIGAGKPGISAGTFGVENSGVIAHNIGKATMGGIRVDPITHNIAKSASVGTGGIGVDSFNHNIAKDSQFQHNMVKSAGGGGHIAAGKPNYDKGIIVPKKFDGMSAGIFGVNQPGVITHNIGKATMGADSIQGHNFAKASGVPIGTGFINPGSHISRKAEAQAGHDFAKASGVHIGTGFVNQGSHISRKAEAQAGHDFAKASSVPIGTGFMNPGSHISSKAEAQAGHDFVKASGVHIDTGFVNQGSHNIRKADAQASHDFTKSGGMNGMNVFGQSSESNIFHDINKAQSGMGQPFGLGHMTRPLGGASVVHNVNKVGSGGAAGMGHDRLAAEVGHGLAKNSVANAAGIVDMGSGGAVSMGDPFANQAAARLAQESLHVAQKTVDMASNGGGGLIQPIMHKPAMPKKPVVVPTGYGGRTRRVRIH